MPQEFTAIEPVPILFAYFEYKSKFDFESECFDDCIVIFICAGGRFEYSVGELDSGVAGVGDCVICPVRRRAAPPDTRADLAVCAAHDHASANHRRFTASRTNQTR